MNKRAYVFKGEFDMPRGARVGCPITYQAATLLNSELLHLDAPTILDESSHYPVATGMGLPRETLRTRSAMGCVPGGFIPAPSRILSRVSFGRQSLDIPLVQCPKCRFFVDALRFRLYADGIRIICSCTGATWWRSTGPGNSSYHRKWTIRDLSGRDLGEMVHENEYESFNVTFNASFFLLIKVQRRRRIHLRRFARDQLLPILLFRQVSSDLEQPYISPQSYLCPSLGILSRNSNSSNTKWQYMFILS